MASNVRKDYGPQGSCAPKAALLLAIPVLFVRVAWRVGRRK